MFLLKILMLSLLSLSTIHAATIKVEVYSIKGTSLGYVVFEDSNYGLLIQPNLFGLPTGLHGFHIHQHPNCKDKGMMAGDHFDPHATKTHLGPYGKGHLGDLPVLAVDAKGESHIPLLAPRLKTQDIQGHALMIHAGGDTYSDTPPLGGGGQRIGCGEIIITSGKSPG
jgi:Cu-Zn family superoxide dismutase